MAEREVRFEYLMPREVETAMADLPVLYQPLGMIEWHGYHNLVGLDSLKAHELCRQAALESGGLVMPPLYGGVGGVELEHTFVMDEREDHSVYLRPWLERICIEAKRNGFRGVIILTGHYGPGQQITVRETAVRMTTLLGMPVLGTPEYLLVQDEEYWGDHAAWGETSLMMYLHPGSVDVSRLSDAPHKGVGGRDPKTEASIEDGARLAKPIIARLAAVAKAMPGWDAAQLAAFARAESALVERQKQLAAELGDIWAGWRHIPQGVLGPYGAYVAEGRFAEIEKLAGAL